MRVFAALILLTSICHGGTYSISIALALAKAESPEHTIVVAEPPVSHKPKLFVYGNQKTCYWCRKFVADYKGDKFLCSAVDVVHVHADGSPEFPIPQFQLEGHRITPGYPGKQKFNRWLKSQLNTKARMR